MLLLVIQRIIKKKTKSKKLHEFNKFFLFSPYIIGELPTDACIAENSALNIKVIGTVGCLTESLFCFFFV